MNKNIDWADEHCHITDHFTVKEAILLNNWKRLANDEEDLLTEYVKNNLIVVCNKMEEIRTLLGNKSINVHCMFRSERYNHLIGGANKSKHILGQACDFHCVGLTTDEVKQILLPELDTLNIRMEDNGNNSGWVHIDIGFVMNSRFFKP